ncbi:MAG: hypothetical protein FWD32_00635 [Firmicutes bacterium]|nr:hypothetical protein [Bacillota bacterium]
MIYSKNIVLYSGSSANSICGLVEFKNQNDGCEIRVRHTLNDSAFILTVKGNASQVKTFKVLQGNGVFTLNRKLDLAQNIFVSLIKDDGNTITTAACGWLNIGEIKKVEQKSQVEEVDAPVKSQEVKNSDIEQVKEKITQVDQAIKSFCDSDSKEDGNKPDCASCLYRQNFYSGEDSVSTSAVAGFFEGGSGEQGVNFLGQIKSQIDQLFSTNQAFEALNNAIENSKWVKINYNNNNNHYAIGQVFGQDEQDIKYITYAVPAKYSSVAPVELSGYCQWLPKDVNNPKGEGFWVMYQCAKTGESVKF